MTEHDRFDRLDPATRREQLVKIRQGLSRSLFDGVEPAVMIEPVPAEALRIDVYAANGKTRPVLGVGDRFVARGAVGGPTMGGTSSAPTGGEYIPKAPISTP